MLSDGGEQGEGVVGGGESKGGERKKTKKGKGTMVEQGVR